MEGCSRNNYQNLIVTTDASGAVLGANLGHLVIIVDVISLSTSLLTAEEGGALAVYGASPDKTRAPVTVNPYRIGNIVALEAKTNNTGIIVVTEPRIGSDDERLKNASKAIKGVRDAGGVIEAVVPNIGSEITKLVDFSEKVVLGVSDTGGVAFDAAFQLGAPLIFGTVARTLKHKGEAPAFLIAKRAVELAKAKDIGITVTAASSNSLEDVLAAEYIAQCIRRLNFLN